MPRLGHRAIAAAAIAVLCSLPAAPVPLAAQSATFGTGTVYSSGGVSSLGTNGASMAGMLVTWTFVGGGSSFAAWGDLGDGSWGVNSGGFRVAVSGASDANTILTPWNVTNAGPQTIASIRFNGANGRTLFDCSWSGTACGAGSTVGAADGTSGSARGRTFVSSSTLGGVSAEYTNMYRLVFADAPVGDLFEQLTIRFADGLGAQTAYAFTADTDNTQADMTADVVAPPPPPIPVPEPATLGLTLLAAGGIVLRHHRGGRNER